MNDPVFGPPAFALLLQFTRVQGLAEDDSDLLGPWPSLPRWQGLVGTIYRHGHNRHPVAVQEHADTGTEWQQFTGVRAATFREPHQTILVLQHDSPECEARKDRPVGIDRHSVREPANQAAQWIAEGSVCPAAPVSVAKLMVVERRGDRARVERADVIGG